MTTCTWVKIARPRRDCCLPAVGRTVTTTILLVYQQLPQQPCSSLKKRPDAIQFLRSGGPWVPFPFLRAERWTRSLTTSEAGQEGFFWSGGAAPRSRDVLCVPPAKGAHPTCCQPGVVREPLRLHGSSRVSSLTTFESSRESLRLLRFRERWRCFSSRPCFPH